MASILLTTFNARYIHSAFGLRYLWANMGELQAETRLCEFTLESRPLEVAEQLLARQPRIIGLGVYIWNAAQSAELVRLLKILAPEVVLVLGGPEVSHEWLQQPMVHLADYLITGQADLAFAQLCRRLLAGERPVERVIHASPPPLEQLAWPYAGYSDEDIAQRVLYVEASRGCPFKCEFCLSALDKSAYRFPLEGFLQQLQQLWARGARRFKFVDRTFNLDVRSASAILHFFLDRPDPELFLHFEVIPDRLPAALKGLLTRFPPGSLQLEIGVQSLDPQVQQRISRRQDNERTRENLRWLRQETQAHLHADLIIGLPGEDLQGFGRGFDQLLALAPHEIQLGALKRLRGAPIARHRQAFDLRFSPLPPYEILSTDCIPFPQMQRLKRFARYWDLVGNSGRFRATLPLLLGAAPFARMLALSDWLHDRTGQQSQIALKRLFDLLHEAMCGPLGLDQRAVEAVLREDFARSGIKGLAEFMRPTGAAEAASQERTSHNARQRRHGG